MADPPLVPGFDALWGDTVKIGKWTVKRRVCCIGDRNYRASIVVPVLEGRWPSPTASSPSRDRRDLPGTSPT